MKAIILILLSLFLSSCRYAQDLNNVKSLENAKSSLINIQNENLSFENQKILRDYFGKSSVLISNLSNDSRYLNYFHKKFFNYYEDNLCENVFISKELYGSFEKKCIVNGFYICPEVFRDFKEKLVGFYQVLTELEKKNLKKEEACLKLINEWGLDEN